MTHTTIGGRDRPAAPPKNTDFEHPHPRRLPVDIPQEAGCAGGVLHVQGPEVHLTPGQKKEAALEVNKARKSLSDSAEGRVTFEEGSVLFSLGMTNA